MSFRGRHVCKPPVRPVAFMMALSDILTAYSTFCLLAGLAEMIFEGSGLGGGESARGSYVAFAMVPSYIVSILACEVERVAEKCERNKLMEK